MAEIAAVFHWGHGELAAMSIDELITWRERAVTIWNRMQGNKETAS